MNIERLFLEICNMSVTASYIIIAVLFVRVLLIKAPKIFSYSIWSVVLFRLLTNFSFESFFSIFTITGQTEDTIRPFPIEFAKLPETTNVIQEANSTVVVTALERPPFEIIYPTIWLIGIAVMVVYSVISLIKLRRKLIGATPLEKNIYIADHIDSPFVMGLIRPKIYLPSNLTDTERAFIINHEQTHIKRLDHITRILSFIALAVHWFNPLVWTSFVLSGKDMETSCDESVMKKMNTDIRADYSEALLKFATGKKLIAATPLAFGEGDTKSRVKNVMKYKKPVVWVSAICLILVSVIAVSLMSNSKDNEQDSLLENGTYYMFDKQNKQTVNSIQIKDNTFSFTYDLLSSYYVYGNYKIEGNTLIATTNDGLYKYVFEIDGNELIFNENESSPVKLIDDRLGVQVENGSIFKYNNIETETEFISKYSTNTSTKELYVMTDDNAPIGCEFGMQNADDFDFDVAQKELWTLQGFNRAGIGESDFIIHSDSDITIKNVTVYRANDMEVIEFAALFETEDSQKILSINDGNAYFYFVDLEANGQSNVLYFSVGLVTTSTLTPKVTSPILMADDSIGAAVLLDYADDEKIVFHGYFGLFIYDLTTEKITFHADLTAAIGVNYVQGDNYAEVLVSGDGKTVMAYQNDTLGNYENVTALYVDIETGEHEFRKYEPMDVTVELFDSSLLQGMTISELKYVTNDREYLLFDGFKLY